MCFHRRDTEAKGTSGPKRRPAENEEQVSQWLGLSPAHPLPTAPLRCTVSFASPRWLKAHPSPPAPWTLSARQWVAPQPGWPLSDITVATQPPRQGQSLPCVLTGLSASLELMRLCLRSFQQPPRSPTLALRAGFTSLGDSAPSQATGAACWIVCCQTVLPRGRQSTQAPQGGDDKACQPRVLLHICHSECKAGSRQGIGESWGPRHGPELQMEGLRAHLKQLFVEAFLSGTRLSDQDQELMSS